MILNTGNRTDIPAFYSDWFYHRIQEGFVLARNPYYPRQVLRYQLNPEVVDAIVFTSKNPIPMLPQISLLDRFETIWHFTVTPYGKEIEPNVPNKKEILNAIRILSTRFGKNRIVWRYDPVFLDETYTVSFHQKAFHQIATYLKGYTERVVVSFLDLYEKTKKNFPEGKEVSKEDQIILTKSFVQSAKENGMEVRMCLEEKELAQYGAYTDGCMNQAVLEEMLGFSLQVPSKKGMTREGCTCLLGNDIGAYNTCMHLCKYCYANYDKEIVFKQYRKHNPNSPLLIGELEEEDVVKDAVQVSWRSRQLSLF